MHFTLTPTQTKAYDMATNKDYRVVVFGGAIRG